MTIWRDMCVFFHVKSHDIAHSKFSSSKQFWIKVISLHLSSRFSLRSLNLIMRFASILCPPQYVFSTLDQNRAKLIYCTDRIGGQVWTVPNDLRGLSCFQPRKFHWKLLWFLYIQSCKEGIRTFVSSSPFSYILSFCWISTQSTWYGYGGLIPLVN